MSSVELHWRAFIGFFRVAAVMVVGSLEMICLCARNKSTSTNPIISDGGQGKSWRETNYHHHVVDADATPADKQLLADSFEVRSAYCLCPVVSAAHTDTIGSDDLVPNPR